MNRGWRPRELLTAIREDLGKLLTESCHALHARAVDWCSEVGVGSHYLEIIKLTGQDATEASDYYRCETGKIFFDDLHLKALLEAPLLFYRGVWAKNLNELLVTIDEPILIARISFDSIDDALEHGFPGKGILLNFGIVLDLNEDGFLEVMRTITPL